MFNKLERVLKYHSFNQTRLRFCIDMNSDHYLAATRVAITPDECYHSYRQTQDCFSFHFGIPQCIGKGSWTKNRNGDDWFVYKIPDASDTVSVDYIADIDAAIPMNAFDTWFAGELVTIFDDLFDIVSKIPKTDIPKVTTLTLPSFYDKKLEWFVQNYGVRKKDWIQLLLQRMNMINNVKKWQQIKLQKEKK